jgi:hypothetical protein
MAGYNDPRFAKGPLKGPDTRWRGHNVAPDPDPHDGIIRVFTRGRWMSWEAWKATAKVIRDDNPVTPTDVGTQSVPSTQPTLVLQQKWLF